VDRVLALGLAVSLAGAPGAGAGSTATPARASPVHGRVTMDNYSTDAGVPAVTFDHWSHRARYRCRVCHVDVGFALGAGETQVSAASNEDGRHCGACHDGKKRHEGRPVFRACRGWPRADAARGCTRCHTGATDDPGPGYGELARRLPADAAGNVDWAEATRRELVTPLDAAEGVSVKPPAMRMDRDVTIRAVGTWLTNVTFSHRKHAAWTGCELCHPEVFPIGRRGPAAGYGMEDVRGGRYCGVCHRNAAFPLVACQRCHAGEARPFR
jgi:c(7)-type cytochrome triheme protein